jgi:hypothetical protein
MGDNRVVPFLVKVAMFCERSAYDDGDVDDCFYLLLSNGVVSDTSIIVLRFLSIYLFHE